MPETANVPFPWRGILTALMAANYMILAALGIYGALDWGRFDGGPVMTSW